MRRVIVAVAAVAVAATAALMAQGPAPAAAFEVVSVKRNQSGDQNSSTRPRPGGGLTVTNNTLRALIRNAYRRENFEIVGGPGWIDNYRFDIVAAGGNQEVPFEVMVARLRTLLADRFRLAVHDDTRELPIYELVMTRADGRPGPQIRQSAIDCRPASTGGARPPAIRPPGLPAEEQPLCGIRRRQGFVAVAGSDLADMALALSGLVERTVVERTGLTGTFDLTLTWDADLTAGQGVSLFTAVQEQLGLKLETRRGPVAVLVIDNAELPAED